MSIHAVLRAFDESDSEKLGEMYCQFEPKGEFQGLPPRTASQIREWLSQLCEHGFHQFVVEVEGRIVGHGVLCPSQRKTEAELAIFVHQDYRGYGLGKKLLLGTLNFGCKKLELERVWIFVMGSNSVALRLFEGVGFRAGRGGDPLAWEMEMERTSHCTKCKGEKCIAFGEVFPMVVEAHPHHAAAR
jgi:RimJ/RimL family protein N-acetyltransferase